ncbi:MAG: hypothetical protein ABI401_15510 [Candidatus Dormibacter sp.]
MRTQSRTSSTKVKAPDGKPKRAASNPDSHHEPITASLLGLQARVGNQAVGLLMEGALQREIIGVEADWIKGIHVVEPQDQHEFDLLKGKVATAAGEPIADLDAYLKQRRSTFGSDDAYRAYGAIADAELEADKDRPPPPKGPMKLRSMLEFGSQPETQTLYYRWVRKGYEDKAGVTGDIGAYIRRASARSDRLRSSVRDAYGGKQAWRAKGWDLQGFNPRPVKTATFRYQLGTLSEHAKGSAVDIDPDHNPPLLLSQWAWIEKFTGLKVNRNAGEWDKNPQVLWESIKGLSDAFVKKVATRVAEEEETQRWWAAKVERWSRRYHLLDQPLELSPQWTEPGLPMSAGMKRAALASPGARATAADNLPTKGAKKPGPRKPPIDIVFADQPSMKKWKDGFFALPWDLVTKLHDLQLVWGATFSSKVDLHHFELPAGVVDEEEAEVAKQAEQKRLRDATTETTPFGRGTESP